MKKLILLFILFTSLGIMSSKSQCTISDLKVRLIQVNTGTCEITFDLSWTQDVNNGNKFAYVHMWTQSGYHTPVANWAGMYSNPRSYPIAADLANSLSTIVIDDNSANTPLIGGIYHPDPSYILPQLSGLSLVKVHLNNTLIERITVQNIKLTLPSCTGVQTIWFDIWASQSANGKNVHCSKQGANLVINEVKPIGFISCVMPRQFQVFIQNTGPVLNNVSYDVHLDYPPIGIINPTDTVIFTSENISLPANGFYTSAVTGYLPYSNRDPSAGLPLIIEVTVPFRPNTTTAIIDNGCGPLSVKFTSFTAIQVKDKIVLNWQTATEQNNSGFEVQRKQVGNEYNTIAFIPSKAKGGNSELLLDYSYTDNDNLTGAGQVYYRIKQINMDGKSSFSEIRVVKNNVEKTKILIYPNPAIGSARVILPDGIGTTDILLHDNTGKEIKRWNSVVGHLQIDNLKPGFYLLRIVIKETGELKVNKMIIL